MLQKFKYYLPTVTVVFGKEQTDPEVAHEDDGGVTDVEGAI